MDMKDIEFDDLGAMFGLHMGEKDKRKILPEAHLERVKEAAERYARPNPYKVGDIVTPRKDSGMKGVGEPHVVVEVLTEPRRTFEGSGFGGSSFGANMDVRVMCLMDDLTLAFWGESWMLDKWESKE